MTPAQTRPRLTGMAKARPFIPASSELSTEPMPPGEILGAVAVDLPGDDYLGSILRDRDILAAALRRLAQLHGQNIPGEMPNDIDMTGLSPEFVGLVDWARRARLS